MPVRPFFEEIEPLIDIEFPVPEIITPGLASPIPFEEILARLTRRSDMAPVVSSPWPDSSRGVIPFLHVANTGARYINIGSRIGRTFSIFIPEAQLQRNHEDVVPATAEMCNERQIILDSFQADDLPLDHKLYERIQKLYDPVTQEAILHPCQLAGDHTNHYFEYLTLMALKRNAVGFF